MFALNISDLHASLRKPIPETERMYSGNTKIYIKRHTKTYEKSKIGRQFDCVHACFYCTLLFSNIQVHLEHHSENSDVKKIAELKRQAKCLTGREKWTVKEDIKCHQTLLRNKGDNQHNQSVIKEKDGELIIARRTYGYFDHREYGCCPECLEWIRLKDNYRKHMKNCPCKMKSPNYVKHVQQLIFENFENRVCGLASNYLKKRFSHP